MRRRYLWLLAVFVPTVLGLAALSYLIFAPNSQTEAATAAPIVRQAPQVEDTISDETFVAPGDADVIESSTPRNDETPVVEPESSPQRPAHAESNDIIGPPMLASSTAADSSTDAPAPARSRGSIRLASLSAAGGGGGGAPSTDVSAKTSGDSATAPVDTSDSGTSDSSNAGGSSDTGDTDPNGGKGGAAPNTPNTDEGDHENENSGDREEEDPPLSDNDADNDADNEPDNDPYPTDPFPHEGEHEPVQVPEPASFGLLLLGLAGFAAGKRRKN